MIDLTDIRERLISVMGTEPGSEEYDRAVRYVAVVDAWNMHDELLKLYADIEVDNLPKELTPTDVNELPTGLVKNPS